MDSHHAQVDTIFAEFDRSDTPGCAVAVIKSGHVVYARGYGIADLDHGIAITPDTIFHAASLAKQFTAMCILLLKERGRLCLDDDVRTYLSADLLARLPSPAKLKITIRDVLGHIGGLRDQWTLVTMADWRLSDDVVTRDDVLDLLRRMKSLDFNPGEAFNYSNTGYMVAGEIVSRSSGLSLAQFAHNEIFQPLGMTHTRFSESHGLVVHHRANGYKKINDRHFCLAMPNYDLTGPTNLLTTVTDLAHWDRNFETKVVGGDVALSEMQTSGILSNGTKTGYGFGLFLSTYRGLAVVEHNGRDAGYRSHLMRFPDQHFAVACLSNLALPTDTYLGDLARRVADIYLAGNFAAASTSDTVAPIQRELEAMAGLYRHEGSGALAHVSFTEGQLKLAYRYDFGALLPLGQTRFRWLAQVQPADVELMGSGNPARAQLLLPTGGGERLPFDRMGETPLPPNELEEYSGTYYSDEINAYYDIGITGSSLAISRHRYPLTVLTSLAPGTDFFSMENFSVMLPICIIAFSRDAQHRISGFQLEGLASPFLKDFLFSKCP